MVVSVRRLKSAAYSTTMPSIFQNPGIFAAAALRRVDHQRAFAQGHARQPAGDDGDSVAVEGIGAQVDVAAVELLIEQGRVAAERQGGLGNIVARVGADLPAELFAFFLR